MEISNYKKEGVSKEEIKSEIIKEKYKVVNIKDEVYLEPAKTLFKGEFANLKDYIALFFSKEVLSSAKGNAFDCPKCKKAKSKAIREYFLYKPPKIFIVQLKRFSGTKFTLRKNSKRVAIPLTLSLDDYILLNNKPSTDQENEEKTYQYQLYGVISHSGNMTGGHYVAYIKAEEKWYYTSDTHVTEVSEKRVIESEGYIMFYRLNHT